MSRHEFVGVLRCPVCLQGNFVPDVSPGDASRGQPNLGVRDIADKVGRGKRNVEVGRVKGERQSTLERCRNISPNFGGVLKGPRGDRVSVWRGVDGREDDGMSFVGGGESPVTETVRI